MTSLTPEHLDTLFPDRQAAIERGGGCNPALSGLFVPVALLADLTDEQVESLTPNWRRVTKQLMQAAAAEAAETDDVPQAS